LDNETLPTESPFAILPFSHASVTTDETKQIAVSQLLIDAKFQTPWMVSLVHLYGIAF
jgi:hypothetical protein